MGDAGFLYPQVQVNSGQGPSVLKGIVLRVAEAIRAKGGVSADLEGEPGSDLEAVEWLFTRLDEHPLPEESFAEWEELQDGAAWRYRVSASLPPWLDFPAARQAVWLERWVWHKRSRQQRYSVQYALSSLSPQVGGGRAAG